ncbi:MAG TPA: PHP domain-containing protein [Bdellovibrionales bacterium]|nr:PHP domain-containing protein [Bdellovibrionales bacterium]
MKPTGICEPILADLHVHSTFSDGKLSIPEVVDFYGGRGFGCIAITDHVCEATSFLGVAASYLNRTLTKETFPRYIEVLRAEADRAWLKYRMILLPGFELTKNSWFNHRSAHILGLGIEEYISAEGDIIDLARAIRSHGGLAIAAHPVSTGKFEPQTYHLWSRRHELRNEFDAWEVASGTKFFSEVHESGLPLIATSDLHHPKQINSWKTILHCDLDRNSILEAIRKQHLEFVFYDDSKAFAREKIESNIGSVSLPVNVFC